MKKKIKEKKEIELLQVAFMRAITMKIGKSGIVCWKFEKNLLVERSSQTFGNNSTSIYRWFQKMSSAKKIPFIFFLRFEAGG